MESVPTVRKREDNLVDSAHSNLPVQKATSLADLPESMQDAFEPLMDWQKTLLTSASAAMPQLGTAAVAVSAGGMYRPSEGTVMTKKPDGTWTPIERDGNGRITKHGAMVKGNALAQAGAVAWSVTSVAVGQAQLMEIAAELNKINQKLDELKAKIDYEKIAAVESAMLGWKEIDYSSPNADMMIYLARNEVRRACMNLFHALQAEANALPTTEKMGFFEGFGSRKNQRFEQARQHFTYLLYLLPAYMKGMMFLGATDGCAGNGKFMTGPRYLGQLGELLPKLQSKVRLVPMIDGLDESPDAIVDNLVKGLARAKQEFARVTSEIASGKPILLQLTESESYCSQRENEP